MSQKHLKSVPPTGPEGRPTILVIDDEPDLRDVFSEILARGGAAVVTAASGEEALPIIRAGGVDAVLSDINMPGIDGLTLLATLRAEGNEIPFVLITAYTERDRVIAALRLGAYDFLEKPVDWVDLERVMRTATTYGTLLRTLTSELEALAPDSTGKAVELMRRYRAMLRELLLLKKHRAAEAAASPRRKSAL